MVLTDEQWAVLEPLVEAVRPKGKTPLRHLRRTLEAIIWRCTNGAKWRAIPAELGPWWTAAQTFIRWSRLGVWQRLLELAQRHAVEPEWIYTNRNMVERLWARLKEWRAVVARSEKTASSFLGVLNLAAALDWLKR